MRMSKVIRIECTPSPEGEGAKGMRFILTSQTFSPGGEGYRIADF